MSKYYSLWEYIKDINQDKLLITFDDVEKILGFPIDHSFLNSKKELNQYGFNVEKISLKNKTILITKNSNSEE